MGDDARWLRKGAKLTAESTDLSDSTLICPASCQYRTTWDI